MISLAVAATTTLDSDCSIYLGLKGAAATTATPDADDEIGVLCTEFASGTRVLLCCLLCLPAL